MHWLAWTGIAMWLLPVPYLWWSTRKDAVPRARTWRSGLAAIIWPLLLLFVAVVAAIGSRRRLLP